MSLESQQSSRRTHPFDAAQIERDATHFDVTQGPFGDCWFEAPLAGFARTDRGSRALSSMIADSGNGYVVTFPGDKTHPVTVSKSEVDWLPALGID